MKVLKIGAGVLVALVAVVVIGVMVMVSRANARLERRWDDVKGVAVPVPWPLDETELGALREQKKAELAAKGAAAGARGGAGPPPPPPAAPPAPPPPPPPPRPPGPPARAFPGEPNTRSPCGARA